MPVRGRFALPIRIPFGYDATARGVPRVQQIKGDFMTLVSRISIAAIAAMMVLPVAGQTTRRRAVSPTGDTAGPTTSVVIRLKDATTGLAVEDANVTYANQPNHSNAAGQAVVKLPIGKPATISVEHPAYNILTQSITAQAGGTYDVSLTQKPSVVIKLVSGETHIVDLGTAQFAYSVTFSSYVRTDKGNFCIADGSDFAPDKTEIARVIGPAVAASQPACCQFGSVMSATVQMKTGANVQVYFKDSCSGNEVDFVGREKSTGRYQYFRFTDIAEIDFP